MNPGGKPSRENPYRKQGLQFLITVARSLTILFQNGEKPNIRCSMGDLNVNIHSIYIVYKLAGLPRWWFRYDMDFLCRPVQ